MYQWFNVALFEGALPYCILNFSRKAKSRGFFAPTRWARGKRVAHEISLNPEDLRERTPREVASTLVHEMVHLWQHEKGKPSRAGYHNEQWAMQMERVGLMPSSTGAPGGKRVGQSMTHYIVDGGPFALAFEQMPADYLLPWLCEREPTKESKAKAASKLKYTCPGCEVNVWGKPELRIACGDCSDSKLVLFEAEA